MFIITRTDCSTSETQVIKVHEDRLNALDQLYQISRTDKSTYVLKDKGLYEFTYDKGLIFNTKRLVSIFKIHEYDDNSDMLSLEGSEHELDI